MIDFKEWLPFLPPPLPPPPPPHHLRAVPKRLILNRVKETAVKQSVSTTMISAHANCKAIFWKPDIPITAVSRRNLVIFTERKT